MKRYSRGIVWAIMEADEPIHHGGEPDGNDNSFRTREVVTMEEGERGDYQPIQVDVPFISGNSIKHWLREQSALFALEALGFEQGELDKSVTRLLFNGGNLQAGGGSQLADARRAEEIFPALSLSGYAAGNQMSESTVKVKFAEVVCRENRRRRGHVIEEYAPEYGPLLDMSVGRFIKEGHFEAPGDAHQREHTGRWTDPDQREEVVDAMADNSTEDLDVDGRGFHTFDVLKTGTVLVCGFEFPQGITELELAAFRSAFAYGSLGRGIDGGLRMELGGKTKRGFGEVSTHLHGKLAEGIDPVHEYRDTDAFAVDEDFDDPMTEYVERLRDSGKDEAYDALEGVVS